MRIFLAMFAVFCLAGNVCAMDDQTRKEVIAAYNFTADMYGKIVRLFDDLENKLIDTERAEDKVQEWTKLYRDETSSVPSEARGMREKMVDVLKAAQDAAEDYEPSNRRTKDALSEFEEAKAALKKVMTDVKYLVE